MKPTRTTSTHRTWAASGRRRRAAVVASAVIVAAAGLIIAPGAAVATGAGCPGGFADPGPATFAQAVTQPRIVAGLAAGEYTLADLQGVFASLDTNGDGTICLKAVSPDLRGQSGKSWAYYYLAVDNKHPVR